MKDIGDKTAKDTFTLSLIITLWSTLPYIGNRDLSWVFLLSYRNWKCRLRYYGWILFDLSCQHFPDRSRNRFAWVKQLLLLLFIDVKWNNVLFLKYTSLYDVAVLIESSTMLRIYLQYITREVFLFFLMPLKKGRNRLEDWLTNFYYRQKMRK